MAALGGTLGLLIGANGMRALTALLTGVPRLDELRFDCQAFAFTAAVSLVTGLLFGLVPAIRAARPDLQETFKEGCHGVGSEWNIVLYRQWRESVHNLHIVNPSELLPPIMAGLFNCL